MVKVWLFSVGKFQLSFSSGIPVYMYLQVVTYVTQWYPSVHCVNQLHSSGIPVYIGPASGQWLSVRPASPTGDFDYIDHPIVEMWI